MPYVRVHASPSVRPASGADKNRIEYESSPETKIRLGNDTIPTYYRGSGLVVITYRRGAPCAWAPLIAYPSPYGGAPTRLVFDGNFPVVVANDGVAWYAEVDVTGATVTVDDPAGALPAGAAARILTPESLDLYSDGDPWTGPHTPP